MSSLVLSRIFLEGKVHHFADEISGDGPVGDQQRALFEQLGCQTSGGARPAPGAVGRFEDLRIQLPKSQGGNRGPKPMARIPRKEKTLRSVGSELHPAYGRRNLGKLQRRCRPRAGIIVARNWLLSSEYSTHSV